jgi:hypothetical protein
MDENFDEGEDMEIFDDSDVIELEENAFLFDPYNMESEEDSNTGPDTSNLTSEHDESNQGHSSSGLANSPYLTEDQVKLINNFSIEQCLKVIIKTDLIRFKV